MAVDRPRSEVEIIARNRVLIASVAIYLLTVGFVALGDRLYTGTPHPIYPRLAAIPFFLLILVRWLRLVRVRPPVELLEARQLIAMGRPRAARDKLAQVPTDTTRVDRARRILHNGLAIPVADEILLETGRCSLQLGDLPRAIDELGRAHAHLPARADVALDFAEALSRADRTDEASDVLRRSLPYMDAVDVQTLHEQPVLLRLLDDCTPPRRSMFHRRILVERVVLIVMAAAAAVHALHMFLGLF